MTERSKQELIELFYSEADRRLEQLQADLAVSRLSNIRDEAHALKSESGNLGLVLMFQLCYQLEQTAVRGAEADIAGILDGIRAEYVRVKDFFSDYLGSS